MLCGINPTTVPSRLNCVWVSASGKISNKVASFKNEVRLRNIARLSVGFTDLNQPLGVFRYIKLYIKLYTRIYLVELCRFGADSSHTSFFFNLTNSLWKLWIFQQTTYLNRWRLMDFDDKVDTDCCMVFLLKFRDYISIVVIHQISCIDRMSDQARSKVTITGQIHQRYCGCRLSLYNISRVLSCLNRIRSKCEGEII